MRRTPRLKSSLLPAAALLLWGCGSRTALLEFERPWWREYREVWEDTLVGEGAPVTLLVSSIPSAALAVDPWGRTLARVEQLEGQLWVRLYRLDSAEVSGAYLVSKSPSGAASAAFPRPEFLWISDGVDVYSLRPGGRPLKRFAGGRLAASERGNLLAVTGPAGAETLSIRDASGRLLHSIPQLLRPLAFSPDERHLAVLDEMGTLSLIDVRTATISKFEAMLGAETRIAEARFLPDGHNVVALGAREGRLALLHGAIGPGVGRRLGVVAHLASEATGAQILGVRVQRGNVWVYLLERAGDVSSITRIDPLSRRKEVVRTFSAKAVAGLLLN